MISCSKSFLQFLFSKIPQDLLKAVIDASYPAFQEQCTLATGSAQLAPESFFLQPKSLFEGIDPSWYEDIVVACPQAMQSVVLQAIREEMSLDGSQRIFSEAVRRFLLIKGVASWPDKEIQQRKEEVIFPFFTGCTKKQIYAVSDLICIHDLVVDIKKTVDKKKLHLFVERLTETQHKYLKTILHGTKASPLCLFDSESFLKASVGKAALMLRVNGLERIGWLLKKEKQSTVWHVIHTIEKQDAVYMQEGMKKEKIPCSLGTLQECVANSVQFVQEKE